MSKFDLFLHNMYIVKDNTTSKCTQNNHVKHSDMVTTLAVTHICLIQLGVRACRIGELASKPYRTHTHLPCGLPVRQISSALASWQPPCTPALYLIRSIHPFSVREETESAKYMTRRISNKQSSINMTCVYMYHNSTYW